MKLRFDLAEKLTPEMLMESVLAALKVTGIGK